MDRRDNRWTLDKKIPISMIVFLIGQIACFIYYSAKQDSRMTRLEERNLEDRAAITSLMVKSEWIVRMEIETTNLKTQLTEMRTDIKQLSLDISRRDRHS